MILQWIYGVGLREQRLKPFLEVPFMGSTTAPYSLHDYNSLLRFEYSVEGSGQIYYTCLDPPSTLY